MAFSLLARMEGSRLEKETILTRRGKNWPLISVGIILLASAIAMLALTAVADALLQGASSATESSSTSVVEYICAACFGIPAILLFLLGALLTINTNRQIDHAEKEYQSLRFQVLDSLDRK